MNSTLRRIAASGLALWILAGALGVYSLMPLRKKLKLGIDLVGGTYITLQVDTDKAIESNLVEKAEEINKTLQEKHMAIADSIVGSNGVVRMTFKSGAEASAASSEIKEREVTRSLDGATITLGLTEREQDRAKADAVQRNIEVLRTRLDKVGVAEIAIAAKGDKAIVVELPDVSNPQEAKDMIGKPAVLDFRLVEKEGGSEEDLKYEYGGQLPANLEIVPGVREGRMGRRYYVVNRNAPITGKHIRDARQQIDREQGIMVAFELTPEGGAKFGDLTGKNVGKHLAIVLDGEVLSAPVIRTAITGGSGTISGNFDSAEAKRLALLLKSGAFVAPVTFEDERQVGALLGYESIKAGVISCIVGLALLLIFGVILYGAAGLLAFVTLLFNLLFILVGMSLLGATLTLPGIAGLVLTLGMAIDASILIFERARELVASGSSTKQAIEGGFSGALRVIFDSNFTHLIVSFFLYKFGAGPIQGFAVIMILGTVSTLLTGLFFLKSAFRFVFANFNVQKLGL